MILVNNLRGGQDFEPFRKSSITGVKVYTFKLFLTVAQDGACSLNVPARAA